MPKEVRVYSEAEHHVPTAESREYVQRAVACGLNEGDIAYLTGLTPAQIMYYYKAELENGLRMTTAKVGGKLLENALHGDPGSQQFWLRHRAGWQPPQKVEMSGPNGAPIEITERNKIVDDIMGILKKGINPRANDPVPSK